MFHTTKSNLIIPQSILNLAIARCIQILTAKYRRASSTVTMAEVQPGTHYTLATTAVRLAPRVALDVLLRQPATLVLQPIAPVMMVCAAMQFLRRHWSKINHAHHLELVTSHILKFMHIIYSCTKNDRTYSLRQPAKLGREGPLVQRHEP